MTPILTSLLELVTGGAGTTTTTEASVLQENDHDVRLQGVRRSGQAVGGGEVSVDGFVVEPVVDRHQRRAARPGDGREHAQHVRPAAGELTRRAP